MTTLGRFVLAVAAIGLAPAVVPPGWPVAGGPFEARVHAQGDRRQEAIRRRQDALRRRQDEVRRRRAASRQGPVATESFSRRAQIGREGAFSIVNASGAIVVNGGGGDDVRIGATKRVWRPTEAEAKALLSDIDIQVTERAGAIDVRTVFPRQRGYDAEVDYTITLPAGASVSIRAVSGDVRVTNVRGELRAEVVSGNLVASSVGQVRSLRTLSGNIQLENAGAADLTASTVGGAILIRKLKAQAADLRAVSGNIEIIDGESDRLTARSLSGDVAFSGRLGRGARYTLQTQSGDIRVAPAGNDGFEVEAAALNGGLRSDFPLTLEDAREPGRGRGRGMRVTRGVSGDGGALLILRSVSGSIAIVRR